MPAFRSLRKPLLVSLAALFAAATVLYSAVWMYNNGRQLPVELGFDNRYLAGEHCELVNSVVPGSPAETAGLRPGDRIVAINGSHIQNGSSLGDVWARHQPGDAVSLTIERANVATPFVVEGVFRASSAFEGGLTEHVGRDIAITYPVAFLVVGLAVLFLRLEDRNAWLLALMFGGFIGLNPWLRQFAITYRAIFGNMSTALFYCFFAVFPTRSSLDRRLPWLKWVALTLGACLALPTKDVEGYARIAILFFVYGLVVLGFVSLIWNAFSAATPEARRKSRVILWGTLVGVVPATFVIGAKDFFGVRVRPLLGALIIVLLWIFLLSFAYAVVKHRVLDIPVLLRRSARYLLVQRGFMLVTVVVTTAAIWLFIAIFTQQSFRIPGKAAIPAGIGVGIAFGAISTLINLQVRSRVSKRIDRAFFRDAYDARQVLENLAHKSRKAAGREQLAALLESEINQALHPASIAIYLEGSEGQLSLQHGSQSFAAVLSPEAPLLQELARRGERVETFPAQDGNDGQLTLFGSLQPECLVPMLANDGHLAGVVVLGARRSEEPYSGEDKRLLVSVASQAALALESIRRGEEIAERIETERRAAQEMEFAKQVQARLFPQKLPPLKTLEHAGGCIQARQVGGDYYDFLELRPGRLALVLADIAGKGVSGALLMANLQANLRSQYAMAVDDLPRLLQSVNHLFYREACGGADADVGESGISTFFTDSGISFACASSSLTCHSWVSDSLVLKEGIPERRIPFAAFQ
jgi:sigma-B regulation protein RsbU (phosphoserine phosphatase)